MFKLICVLLQTALVWAGVGVLTATAQEPVAGLEEIVVTARKREENLQDVGLAVSALSQTEIEQQFARDIKGLANVAPNLIIDDTSQGPGGNAAIFLRGIGVADVEKNFDPAVAVVIDDIFIGANSGSILRSIDLESVSVARGPQGTMFGRNTIGGAIIVSRSKPTGETGLKIRAGLEDFDTNYMDTVVNFGISETIALKLTAAMRDQSEGYYNNVSLGTDDGKNDYQSFGASVLLTPSDSLEVQLSYYEDEVTQDTPPLLNTAQPGGRHILCGPGAFFDCAPNQNVPITGDRRAVAGVCYQPASFTPQNKYGIATAEFNAANALPLPGIAITPIDTISKVPCSASFDSETLSLKASYDINENMTLDYIYGAWESDESILSTWDGVDAMLYGTSRPAVYDQESHELRLSYDSGDGFDLVAGIFTWTSEYEIWLRSWIGFNPPTLALDIYQYTHQESDSSAIFFEADYDLSDRWTATVGGRYTEDEKISRQIGGQADTSPNFPEAEWSKFTPKLGLRYQYTEDMMLFGTLSRGFRSGGFNGRVGGGLEEATQPYDPETVDNAEFGFKSEWMDNRVRLNASVFFMKFDDKQEELKLPNSGGATGQKTVVVNAAEATITGLEVELQAQVSDALYVRANVGLLDAEYDSFAFTGADGNSVDLSGRDFRRAPDVTMNVDATYSWDMGPGEAWRRGSVRLLGKHFIDNENTAELANGDQTIVDMSVNYRVNQLTFSLFGRNLTDEDGYTHGYDVQPLWSYAGTREPRVVGFEVMASYD
jgi:iron complex outermembrane receptor protein